MKYLYLEKPAYNQEKETISPDYKIENGVFIVDWKIRKKPDEDGYTQTGEEIAELEKLTTEMPAPEPTSEERIAALEKDNAELHDALEALLTGATA